MAQFFSESIPNTRVIAPDHPPVQNLTAYMKGIQFICDQEKIENEMIYGSSFGSLIAQCWVRKNPLRVTHLILSGAAVPDIASAKSKQRWMKFLSLLPVFAIRLLLSFILKLLLRGSVSGLWKQEYKILIRKFSRKDLISRYLIAIDFDNQKFAAEDLENWPGKILLLRGESDRVSGAKMFQRLVSLYPLADARTIQGAGHSAILTHPVEWKQAILPFLTKTAS